MNIKRTLGTVVGLIVFGGTAFNLGKKVERRNNKDTYEKGLHIVEFYILDTLNDAEETLKTLKDIAEKYDCVTVADYYDLLGVQSVFTDNSFGWTKEVINKAKITKSHRGYTIKFPPTEAI